VNRIRPGATALLPWIGSIVVLLLVIVFGNTYLLLVTGTLIIYAISAVGLSLLMGQAGLVSIGSAALMGLGAFTTAILSPLQGWGAFPLPLLVSGIVGGVVGMLIALPAMRLRGVYLALATLALQFFVAFGGDEYQKHTDADSGLPVTPIFIGGESLSYGPAFVLLLSLFLVAAVIVVKALLRHAPGRMWNAIRESELAATSIGVNIPIWKLSAFVVSSVITSVAGSLLAYYSLLVSIDTFSLDFAITFIVMLIVGGAGSIGGAVVGAIIVGGLPYLLTVLTQQLPAGGIGSWLGSHVYYVNNGLYGILVLFVLIYLPEGLVPAVCGRLRAITARRGENRQLPGKQPHSTTTAPVGVDLEKDGNIGEPGRILLQVRDLRVRYDVGSRAVDGISLSIDEGSIVALLGRNGAGKTSTLRALSGFYATEGVTVTGRAMFGGRDLLDHSPTATAGLGVILVPERNKVFPSLTIAEHLRLVAPDGWPDSIARDSFRRLHERLDQPAGLLSGGERQLLALALAAALRPTLLMVDEFSLGLAPAMIQQVGDVICELRRDMGMSVLLVEQNAGAALAIADTVYLLDGGRVVSEGTATAVADHALLLAAASAS
jgi:branched-chain amino acid transport system permease protein